MSTTVPAKNKNKNQPLHNFSLSFPKWGQRSHADTSSYEFEHYNHDAPRKSSTKHKQNKRSKEAVLDGESSSTKAPDFEANVEVKPWNLRPRRSPIYKPRAIGDANCTADSGTTGGVKWRSMRGLVSLEKNEPDNKAKKLWISLSKAEIEEDIYAMTGAKPNRRPKKRNMAVQKQVDNLFPGFTWLGCPLILIELRMQKNQRNNLMVPTIAKHLRESVVRLKIPRQSKKEIKQEILILEQYCCFLRSEKDQLPNFVDACGVRWHQRKPSITHKRQLIYIRLKKGAIKQLDKNIIETMDKINRAAF